jgi:hypothetical protein
MINPDRKLQSIATDVYVRGLSRRLFSSVGLGWKNIEIEGHLAEPGARPDHTRVRIRDCIRRTPGPRRPAYPLCQTTRLD